MTQKKRKQKTSNGTAVGARKTKLSLLQRHLFSKSFSERYDAQTRARVARNTAGASKPKAAQR